MIDDNFSLLSSISLIQNAEHLVEQRTRVENAIMQGDPALGLDTSKALLETVFKTIITDRTAPANTDLDMGPLFRSVQSCLRINVDDTADTLFKRLISGVVHQISELRNNFGAASHGDDAYYQNPIDIQEAIMVARIVDSISGLLIHKHKNHNQPNPEGRIHYEDYPEFNDYWDTQVDGFEINLGDGQKISVPASKILFDNDNSGYRELLIQYNNTEEEDAFEDIEEEDPIETHNMQINERDYEEAVH
ncbi:abortive infection family protein [Endozoicomonas acroporae]|uniref:abortive infection family protein n=1 Tax=Endozoicomonas acroporae TaxID=1701104 RepID=UPI003D79F2C4